MSWICARPFSNWKGAGGCRGEEKREWELPPNEEGYHGGICLTEGSLTIVILWICSSTTVLLNNRSSLENVC
jgi:hypothetical protein